MNNLDAVVFYSHDVTAAVDYYTKFIGLRLEYQDGDKYASLLFDNGVKLGIKHPAEDREVPGSQTFFLTVVAAAVYHDAQQKALHIHKQLTEESWAIEFSVLDPDGNKIEFVQNKLSYSPEAR